jgi:MFS-type transporter involved in bile tolerance (Atg22 family)
MSRRQIGMVIALAGVVAVLIAVLANPLGIGQDTGAFGWKQGVLLAIGIVLIIAGGVTTTSGGTEAPARETEAPPRQ